MAKTIWKYILPRDGASIIINDQIIKILHIENQNGQPTLWAIVNPDNHNEKTEIVAWGTGWDLPEDVFEECRYIGTCGDAYGYIWHYFAATRLSDLLAQSTSSSGTMEVNSNTISSSPYFTLGDINLEMGEPDFEELIQKITDFLEADRKTITNSSLR